PVDRRHAGGIIDSTAILLERHKDRRMAVVITPEGTRRRTENWKKGFYVLAHRTHLPVYAGIVDYRKKTCDILPAPLDLDKPFDAVMKDLSEIYKGAQGKYPENFNF
ncbi:MAG: glycerol acyltransferase, partial [Bacteroidales bacterium]|nr:glycerol acyltransferase [Bacteroidales bacterium]